MLNPVMACGFLLSRTWKSSFFKLPTVCPCESRTTTGTSTAFTATTILAVPGCGEFSLECCAGKPTDKRNTQQNPPMARTHIESRLILVRLSYRTYCRLCV